MKLLAFVLFYGILLFVIYQAYKFLSGMTKRWLEDKQKTAQRFHNKEILKVLLKLDAESLEELFRLYREQFGAGAARYARRTYRKWQGGKVRPNYQTYERFLIHLPKVMDFDLKCEVLRTLMEEYAAQDAHELTVSVSDWEEKITPVVRQMIEKAYTAQLPVEVERKLHWLGQNDMQAAQEILRRSQAEESRIAVSMLKDEFAGIERLLEEKHLKTKVTHELKFPYGTITLNVKRR